MMSMISMSARASDLPVPLEAVPPASSRTGSPARHLRCQAASLFLLCSMNSISTGSPLPLDALTLPGSSGTRPTRAAIGHAASIGQPYPAHRLRRDPRLMRVRFGILGRLTAKVLKPCETIGGTDESAAQMHSKSPCDSDLSKALIFRRSAMSILPFREPVDLGTGADDGATRGDISVVLNRLILIVATISTPAAASSIAKAMQDDPARTFQSSKALFEVERCIVMADMPDAPAVYRSPDRADESLIYYAKSMGRGQPVIKLRAVGSTVSVTLWHPNGKGMSENIAACM
jgi:hypothetical protein